jgi:hypothetical protein
MRLWGIRPGVDRGFADRPSRSISYSWATDKMSSPSLASTVLMSFPLESLKVSLILPSPLAGCDTGAERGLIHTLCQAQACRCPHGDKLYGKMSGKSPDRKQEQGPTHGRVQEAAPRASE